MNTSHEPCYVGSIFNNEECKVQHQNIYLRSTVFLNGVHYNFGFFRSYRPIISYFSHYLAVWHFINISRWLSNSGINNEILNFKLMVCPDCSRYYLVFGRDLSIIPKNMKITAGYETLIYLNVIWTLCRREISNNTSVCYMFSLHKVNTCLS